MGRGWRGRWWISQVALRVANDRVGIGVYLVVESQEQRLINESHHADEKKNMTLFQWQPGPYARAFGANDTAGHSPYPFEYSRTFMRMGRRHVPVNISGKVNCDQDEEMSPALVSVGGVCATSSRSLFAKPSPVTSALANHDPERGKKVKYYGRRTSVGVQCLDPSSMH